MQQKARLLELLICLNVVVLAYSQRFIEKPRDETVQEGQAVLFRCIITNISPQQRVYWYRRSTRTFITENRMALTSPQQNRLRVLGNPGQNEYFLQISNTVLSDAGEYRCGYAIPTMPFFGFGAVLTIRRSPNPGFPVCEVSPQEVDIGSTAVLTCRSEGGHPPASLAWSAGREILTNGKESQNALTVNVQGVHNGLNFVCMATSPALKSPRNCTVTLISITPDVRVEPSLVVAEFGRRAMFTCVAFGFPIIIRYDWKFNNKPVGNDSRIEVSADGRTLIINDIRLHDDETPVHCTATTTHGLSGTSGGLLRVVNPQGTTPITTNATVIYFNDTMIPVANYGKPSSIIIAVIVIAVIVGQVLIIILVYVLHKSFNRMVKERKERRRPPPVARPPDMEENVYVAGATISPLSPDVNPETGVPSILSEPTYQGAPNYLATNLVPDEDIYSQPPSQINSGDVSDKSPRPIPSAHTEDGAGYTELPGTPFSTLAQREAVYLEVNDAPSSTQDVVRYSNGLNFASSVPTSRPKSQVSVPTVLSPTPVNPSESSYGYAEVPLEESQDDRRPPVVISSSPPKTVPPRLPVDKRYPKPHSPPNHPYYGLKPDRSDSQYLSLRHYDDVYADQVLQEGARLNGEVYRADDEHDDDGYIYELPPAESSPDDVDDVPSDAGREYTFMGSTVAFK